MKNLKKLSCLAVLLNIFSMNVYADQYSAEPRKQELLQMFSEHPDYFSVQYRQSILKGLITLGMTPYEAHMAGGKFFYSITNDPQWPSGTDPFKIMWAQSKSPDQSQIQMTFKNATQFPKKGTTLFKVFIEQGKVIKIEAVSK